MIINPLEALREYVTRLEMLLEETEEQWLTSGAPHTDLRAQQPASYLGKQFGFHVRTVGGHRKYQQIQVTWPGQ